MCCWVFGNKTKGRKKVIHITDATLEQSYVERDPRMVERKKYGHKKARKSFQFSKR